MFEQDYIMRLIREMIRAILKLLFHIDTENPTAELLEERESREILERLMELAESGAIDEAENRVYELTLEGDRAGLELALLFYAYLNDKEDGFLRDHGFSREEIRSGVQELASRYGLTGIAEAFWGDE